MEGASRHARGLRQAGMALKGPCKVCCGPSALPLRAPRQRRPGWRQRSHRGEVVKVP